VQTLWVESPQPADGLRRTAFAPTVWIVWLTLLNQAGELVGMVSNILPDDSGKMRLAPIDTCQLGELLETYGKHR
jgi:hypothetical protein